MSIRSGEMDLFNNIANNQNNRLPFDGTVNYYGKILKKEQADYFLKKLLETTNWRSDEVIMFGKKITMKRKVGWYGDKPFEYHYSNTTKRAISWTKALLDLKTLIERESGETFNSCLLNLYHNGDEGMGWHSDDEPDLKKNGAIASLSFGTKRKFVFKHKDSKTKVELYLDHGSLLVMKGTTQTFWMHTLPKSKKITKPRINLTFRTIVD